MHQTFGYISVPSMHDYDVKFSIVPFAPEPPVTVRADPRPFYRLWRHLF